MYRNLCFHFKNVLKLKYSMPNKFGFLPKTKRKTMEKEQKEKKSILMCNFCGTFNPFRQQLNVNTCERFKT